MNKYKIKKSEMIISVLEQMQIASVSALSYGEYAVLYEWIEKTAKKYGFIKLMKTEGIL